MQRVIPFLQYSFYVTNPAEHGADQRGDAGLNVPTRSSLAGASAQPRRRWRPRARPGRPRPLLGHAGAGPAQAARDGGPPDKAQRNFTDPDSRIQPTRDGFIAGYNGEIAVDAAHQIIVAQRLQTNPADYAALNPLVDQARPMSAARSGRSPAMRLSHRSKPRSQARRRIRAYLAPGRASAASPRPPTTSASRTFLDERHGRDAQARRRSHHIMLLL